MKKNLILLTSLIPLGISTVPFCVSCGGPTITDNSISWDFVRDGNYNSQVAIKEQGSEMTQDEATKVYFNDVKSNPYIFIDDFMVSLNAEINEGRSYGYTLSKGVIDLKFNGVNDENYISFEINLDIEVQQNGKKVSTFNIYEDVKNIAFASEYKDIDLSPIVSVAPCWGFSSVIEQMTDGYRGDTKPELIRQYFAMQSDKDWHIKGKTQIWDIVYGEDTEEFDLNKTNYASIDDEALTDAVSQLVPISYSQYLSAQTVKVDFVLDKPTVIEGDQALQPQTLPVNIELGKRYIVSADIELLSISGTISHFDVGIDFTSEYDDFVNIINGITFFTVNKNKTYPPEHGHSTGWKEIGIYTHVLKPQDKIIVDFWVVPTKLENGQLRKQISLTNLYVSIRHN